MPYALNVKKGTLVQHPSLGKLVGGMAKEIGERDVLIAKHLVNVVVFDGFEPKKDSVIKAKVSEDSKENGSKSSKHSS